MVGGDAFVLRPVSVRGKIETMHMLAAPLRCAGKCGTHEVCSTATWSNGYCLAPSLRREALGQPAFVPTIRATPEAHVAPRRFFLKRKTKETDPMAKKVASSKKKSASISKKSVSKAVAKPAAKVATKPAAKASSETAPKDAKPSRYRGVATGLSVKAFQNQTLAANLKAKLTDEQLAESWREEFPLAAKFTADHVRSVRAAFNRGDHGNEEPEVKVPAYDETGTALPLRGAKAAAKAEAKAAKAEAAEPKGKVLKLKKKAS